MNQHAKLQFPSSASVFLNEKYNPDDQQYYQKKQIDIDSYLRVQFYIFLFIMKGTFTNLCCERRRNISEIS
jgi:hypothetical protein